MTSSLKSTASKLLDQLQSRDPRDVDVDDLIAHPIAQHYWTYQGPDDEITGPTDDSDFTDDVLKFMNMARVFREGPEMDLFERVYWDNGGFRFVCYKEDDLFDFYSWWNSANFLDRAFILMELKKIVFKYHCRGTPFGAMKALAIKIIGGKPAVRVTRLSTIGSGSMLADKRALLALGGMLL